jgi:hypothetical protein
MHHTVNIVQNRLVFLIGLLILSVPFANAANVSRLSGSYQVVQKTDVGSQTRIRLQLRLTNRGPSELRIQRVTLWDFSHAYRGGTQPLAIVLRAGASADAIQEFTIPRAEYELWTRGTRPRLVVELQAAHGRTTAEPVRLDRVKGKAA